MTVKHVLRDGTVLTDITGHIVREEDAKGIYALIERINKETKKGLEDDQH